MVGYGSPVFDSFSTVVWIIIFVGFGTPMLLIVITIVYVIVKKIKARKATSSYGMINWSDFSNKKNGTEIWQLSWLKWY